MLNDWKRKKSENLRQQSVLKDICGDLNSACFKFKSLKERVKEKHDSMHPSQFKFCKNSTS